MDTTLTRQPQEESGATPRRHVRHEVFEGAPWPEALAGAVVGAFLVMSLAFVQATTSWIDMGSPTLIPLLIIGALIGAAVSWVLARPKLERLATQEQRAEERGGMRRRGRAA